MNFTSTFRRIAATLVGVVAVFALMLAVAPEAALAGGQQLFNPNDPLGVEFGNNSGLTNTDPRIVAGRVIQVALGLIGIIVVVLIIFAGFRWMTSAGNDDQIRDAKKMLSAAVIGLLIVLMAYSLTTFIIGELYNATAGVNLY